jgi:hypothetical protein
MSDFRMDEAGLFLERQLEYIRPQIFEVAYAHYGLHWGVQTNCGRC